MIVVLDTNALLMCLPKKSDYRPIFDKLIEGTYSIAISNEILSEYTEVIERKTNPKVANNIAEFLVEQPNVEKFEAHFKWNLIGADEEDNKFVDCAVVARAKYIVTNDRHFNILKRIPFPKVDVVNIEEFLAEIQQL